MASLSYLEPTRERPICGFEAAVAKLATRSGLWESSGLWHNLNCGAETAAVVPPKRRRIWASKVRQCCSAIAPKACPGEAKDESLAYASGDLSARGVRLTAMGEVFTSGVRCMATGEPSANGVRLTVSDGLSGGGAGLTASEDASTKGARPTSPPEAWQPAMRASGFSPMARMRFLTGVARVDTGKRLARPNRSSSASTKRARLSTSFPAGRSGRGDGLVLPTRISLSSDVVRAFNFVTAPCKSLTSSSSTGGVIVGKALCMSITGGLLAHRRSPDEGGPALCCRQLNGVAARSACVVAPRDHAAGATEGARPQPLQSWSAGGSVSELSAAATTGGGDVGSIDELLAAGTGVAAATLRAAGDNACASACLPLLTGRRRRNGEDLWRTLLPAERRHLLGEEGLERWMASRSWLSDHQSRFISWISSSAWRSEPVNARRWDSSSVIASLDSASRDLHCFKTCSTLATTKSS
mmetsp:Transcript_81284/g.226313  ORF Transcript_81284/g.226313 Transcript_81284/m.226313 type:complete len:469 (-) Transcript_81284:630-2036(-)